MTDNSIEWAGRFERVLIHLDVDVMDYEDFPIAENTRRKEGLTFDQTMQALDALIQAPNLPALMICEINPDHGLDNDETRKAFAERLAHSIIATRGERES